MNINICKMLLLALWSLVILPINLLIAQNGGQEHDYNIAITSARIYADSMRLAHDIPGLSIAINVNGKLVWAAGFGYADVRKAQPVMVETKFRIGSISKTLTGLALGKLYENGLLKLDDIVQDYIPNYPLKKYPITVLNLACHQSGMAHYKGLEYFSKKHYDSVNESIQVFANRKLKFEPGTDFQYSTYGYVLLSGVIAGASNMPFLDYMQEQILIPLGATHTIEDDLTKKIEHKTTFYVAKKNGAKKAPHVDLSNKWAGGGYLSTATDLVNIFGNIDKILARETIDLLTTPVPLQNGEMNPQSYGIGWRHYAGDNGLIIYHHGGMSVGGRAFVATFPNEGVTVAILANAKSDFNLQEAFDIGQLFFE